MKMKFRGTLLCVTACLAIGGTPLPAQAGCDYAWQTDSIDPRCGGRGANIIPGGHLGEDARYTDSRGRQRLYGKNNDP